MYIMSDGDSWKNLVTNRAEFIPEILSAAENLVAFYGRVIGSFEFQLWLGENGIVAYTIPERPPDG